MLSTNLAGAYYCFLFLFFIEYFSTPPGLQHTDPLVGLLLDLLGIVLGPITALVGVNCSPISVIGAGGNSCSATPVCCAENGIVRSFPPIIGEHQLIYLFNLSRADSSLLVVSPSAWASKWFQNEDNTHRGFFGPWFSRIVEYSAYGLNCLNVLIMTRSEYNVTTKKIVLVRSPARTNR